MSSAFKRLSILHIAGGVSIQKLYGNIFRRLSKEVADQTVYVPCNSQALVDKNKEDIPKTKYIYYVVASKLYRILFFPKVSEHFKEIRNKTELLKINYCIAYTVMTDGSLALRLKKTYGIPYSVFVRNTDINVFYKYMVFLRPYFWQILDEAEHINFPNPAYKKRLQLKLNKRRVVSLSKKMQVIPNGIDEFWLNNIATPKIRSNKDRLNLMFVGKIDKNKNVETVIEVLKTLQSQIKCHLTLIGPVDDSMDQLVDSWKQQYSSLITFGGAIYDKADLLDAYKQSDIFIMPSKAETFGLVYIEALSQGLPIIYTKDEGVDGFFDDFPVGVAVRDIHNPNEIIEGIFSIIDNYNQLSINAIDKCKYFNWDAIIKMYFDQINCRTEQNLHII